MEPSDVTHFATSELFRAWLEKHHASSEELWVGYWKKSTGRPRVTWSRKLVDEALCFGWISRASGQRVAFTAFAYTSRVTPRRANEGRSGATNTTDDSERVGAGRRVAVWQGLRWRFDAKGPALENSLGAVLPDGSIWTSDSVLVRKS